MQLLAKVQVIDGALSCGYVDCANDTVYIVNEDGYDEDDDDIQLMGSYCEKHYQILIEEDAKKKLREFEQAQMREREYQFALARGWVSEKRQKEHDKQMNKETTDAILSKSASH